MLRADMAVIQTLRFFCRVGEDPFAFVGKGQVDRRGYLFADSGSTFDFLADAFDRGMISQEAVRQVLVFADQPQKQVFRFDGRASELAGLIAGEEDHPPCSLSVSFEHIFDSLKCRSSCGFWAWNPGSTTTLTSLRTHTLRLLLILNEARKSNNNFIRKPFTTLRVYRPFFGKFLHRVPRLHHIGRLCARYGSQ